mmetsp:Transcript_17155/g.17060  ORF Transcript_17155/g.17060 Transcript_17155/m.17060 type:complete len:205 (-) Transcript_17155:311-925(-)
MPANCCKPIMVYLNPMLSTCKNAGKNSMIPLKEKLKRLIDVVNKRVGFRFLPLKISINGKCVFTRFSSVVASLFTSKGALVSKLNLSFSFAIFPMTLRNSSLSCPYRKIGLSYIYCRITIKPTVITNIQIDKILHLAIMEVSQYNVSKSDEIWASKGPIQYPIFMTATMPLLLGGVLSIITGGGHTTSPPVPSPTKKTEIKIIT